MCPEDQLEAAVPFVAGVLVQHVVVVLQQRHDHRPGARERARILDRRAILDRLVVEPREPLEDLLVRIHWDAGPIVSYRQRDLVLILQQGHGHTLARVADGRDEVVKAVREQIYAGCDQIKIMATGGVMTPGVDPEDAHYSAEEIAAGIAEGRRFGKKSASHAQGAEGILNAVLGGVDSIEHGIFLDERGLEEMLKRGTHLVPTLAAVHRILAGARHVVPD